jgi:hypothetical protein
MSALGHVLFLLPFLRDFVRSSCIASFLKARVLAGGITGTAGHQEGNFSCSPQPTVVILFVDILFADTLCAAIRFVDTLFADTLSEAAA